MGNTGDWSDNNGGPEFMALRANVRRKRREIRRDLTPRQNYLLDDITEGTVDGWGSKSEFDLKDLAYGLGVRVNKIYVLLKELHDQSLITREPTRYPGREILGLNPESFGQILINHQHEKEKKKHLRLVPIQDQPSPLSGLAKSLKGTHIIPKEDLSLSQDIEIIKESNPLDSYRLDKSLRCESGDDSNESEWDARGPEKAEQIRKMIEANFRSMP